MVFDVAGDENVGTCGAGLFQQGGTRTGAVGHTPDAFRAGTADGGGTQVDVRGQHVGQLLQVHGLGQIAGQAEAMRQIPRAGAGGFQHGQIVQMQLAGQPGHRAVAVDVQRGMRGVKRHIVGQQQTQDFVIMVDAVGQRRLERQRMMAEDALRTKLERGRDGGRARIEADSQTRGVGPVGGHLQARSVPGRGALQGGHLFYDANDLCYMHIDPSQ